MPVHILVADDSVTMRRILELTFAGEDAQVTTVESGANCIERARAMRPDIVLADCSMDGVSGYDVAHAVKSDPGLAKTAVILMASQKTPLDEARAKTVGADDHILKPFDTQHVIDRVQQVLGRPRAMPTEPLSLPAAAPPEPVRPAPAVVAPASIAPARQQPAMAAAPMTAPPMRSVGVGAAAGVAAVASGAPMAQLHGKLATLGLSESQVEAVLALSREVVEQVVWEVVPDLAETLIKEEIRRLTSGG